MTRDQVIRSYKWSLIEVTAITWMVVLWIIPPGFGLGIALASATLAYRRELKWRKNFG